MPDYDFHTGEVDGETVAGVMFVAGNGQFYEFRDPETHDEFEKYVDPRTGDVLTHDGPVDRAFKSFLGGRVRALIPAEDWAELRETYLDADEDRLDRVQEQWKEVHRKGLQQQTARA